MLLVRVVRFDLGLDCLQSVKLVYVVAGAVGAPDQQKPAEVQWSCVRTAGGVDLVLMLARRVVAALSFAGMTAALFRLRGQGGVAQQQGGWRELTDAELIGR